jgi:hypothetical protein
MGPLRLYLDRTYGRVLRAQLWLSASINHLLVRGRCLVYCTAVTVRSESYSGSR